VQKRNEEKKRKKVRGYQHIKGCGNRIYRSRSRSTMKRSWSETWRDYRRLYDAFILKIPKEMDMFCESYELLKTLCQIWFFGHISFV